MKRYMTHVGILLLSCMLVSCGGGGGRPVFTDLNVADAKTERLRAIVSELGIDPRVTTPPFPTNNDLRLTFETQGR